MALVLVNIGSNMGERRLFLTRSLAAIGREFGEYQISHVVESDPEGFDSANSFLNIGAAFHSELSPIEILKKLQEIERSLSSVAHRNEEGSYKDREIDIDLIAVAENVVNSEELTLPHPRLHERRFFLEPLMELAPAWRHPITGKDPFQMLKELAEKEKKENSGNEEA